MICSGLRHCRRGALLAPERDEPRNDDDEIDLPKKRLQHRECLPQVARWNQISVANCGERRVAEEQVLIGGRVRHTFKERCGAQKANRRVDEGERESEQQVDTNRSDHRLRRHHAV